MDKKEAKEFSNDAIYELNEMLTPININDILYYE